MEQHNHIAATVAQRQQPATETLPVQENLVAPLPIQCSLTVGAPDDPLEHEADAMADTVMRMPNKPDTSKMSDTFSGSSFLQRKCAACEEEEKAQRKPLSASITPFIQTKTNGEGTTSASLSSKINSSRGNGSSMDNGTKTFMESRFGSDFSSVKIHTGSESVMMNRELSAKAFTVGNDIYFNEGQYNPQSDSGKHLLAHELTHTIQQNGGLQKKIQRYTCTNDPATAPVADMPGCSTDTSRPAHHDADVGFAVSGSNINAPSLAALSALVARWRANAARNDTIRIDAFSSCDGDATNNWKLSCSRAKKIENEMKTPSDGTPGIPATATFLKFAHGETNEFSASVLADNRKGMVTLQPVPSAVPAAPPAAGATDFLVDRVGHSSQSQIFFERGSATLLPDAIANIDALKATSPGSVTLTGFASLEEAPALAQSRANAVRARLTAAPNAVTVTSATGNAPATAGRSNFVDARKVEIVLAGATASTLDCDAVDATTGARINPPTAPCATMDPATLTAFTSTMTVANQAMTDAMNAINPAHASYNPALITRFFGNNSPATMATLTSNLTNLQTHVTNLPAITHCGGQCDTGGCEGGPIAYNHGVDALSTMTLCVPTFKNLNLNDRARNLIHESAHGTSPLGGASAPTEGTKDMAYRHERLIFNLSPEDRLRNSDSYALFAMFAREIILTGSAAAQPTGIAVPEVDTITGFAGADRTAVEMAIAQLEKRLTWARDHSNQLFGQAKKVKDGTLTWAASWANSYMQQLSTLFPVTAPPAAPTLRDMSILGAIIERYTLMKAAVNRDLTINSMPAGLINWPAVPNNLASVSLNIGPDFFRATADNQVSLLLEALSHSTPGVEAAFVPGYVAFAKWIHEHATI